MARGGQKALLYCRAAWLREQGVDSLHRTPHVNFLLCAEDGLDRPLCPALDAVVEIAVAGGAEGLVVEGGGTGGLVELFGEVVEGAKVIGAGGNLEMRGFEEFLVAAVENMGDLAVEDPARTGEQKDRADGAVGGDRGRRSLAISAAQPFFANAESAAGTGL